MPSRFPIAPVLALLAALALAGCESAEERAERFFQSGMELLGAGDVERALVEFRNVFNLDPLHRGARLTYARVTREQGRAGEAYSQYLRVAEQYPEDVEARLALAEMAIEGGDWEEAARHAEAARGQAPDDPRLAVVQAMLDYRAAALKDDRAAALAPVAVARARLEAEPGDLVARRIVIDHALVTAGHGPALAEVEAALAVHPERLELHALRVRLLTAGGDDGATRAALEEMVERFPDNPEVQGALIAFHLSRSDLAAAEAFLRRLAAAEGAGESEKLAVVAFLRRTGGAQPALAELDRLIAAEPDRAAFRALRAGIAFEEGDRAEAIAGMEALLREAPASDETRDLKIALARMLVIEGDTVGARAQVEQVLAENPDHVEALKLSAAWLIDGDRPGEAITALRTALAAAPKDPAILTLMAQAHEREGGRDLAGERYALAVEVSGRAVAESLRYAGFLMRGGRHEAAEAVLEDALQVAPADVGLLTAMAEVQLARGDANRLTRIVWQLRALGTPQATAAADAVEVESLHGQDRVDDTLALLERRSAAAGTAAATGGPEDEAAAGQEVTAWAARVRMIEILIREGRLEAAEAALSEALAAAPQDPVLRFLRAGLHRRAGEEAEAEAILRALLAEDPGAERPLVALDGLLRGQGRDGEAAAAIDAAIAAAPGAFAPRMLKAGRLEAAGDMEGAIALYEALYAENGDNAVVANNLASLMAAHRPDQASLERAHAIAQRLRESEVPAFQDTYGWIEYRRGNHAAALARLEPAAKGLPEDPLVQFHLGMTYHALGRRGDARETLARAVELAGESPLPQFEEARRVLAEIGPE